jgi:hypothetical protein
MRLFWFLSKNENNNGFGAIGLNTFLLTESLWRVLIIPLYFCIVIFVHFDLECMRNLHNEHHLAAQIGTFSHGNMRGRPFWK